MTEHTVTVFVMLAFAFAALLGAGSARRKGDRDGFYALLLVANIWLVGSIIVGQL